MIPVDGLPAKRLEVFLVAPDPLTTAGLASQLSGYGHILLVDRLEDAALVVLLVDSLDDDTLETLRDLRGDGDRRAVVIAATLDDLGLLRAVESGASGLLRRSEVTPARLAEVLVSALSGHGTIPSDPIGSLLNQVGELQRSGLRPNGMLLNGFTARELEVLRLVADGFGTGEIAEKLSYSERTVKSVLHDVTTRFNLRNRCHAVAYALRSGAI